MSTNTARINLIATALVAFALALGCLVGYFALGGKPAPTEAVVPATETACTMCLTGGATGGGGGNLGSVPPPANGALTGGFGGSTGGSGGTSR